ncbi:DEAD/DEAH box helicase [Mesoterricola silvestris]|uniref:DEAD/DEAH box helicase n=1 Tax=Mesoterricola silvestris TaxID=2927979 RepID=A0AA48KC50_9BACT|nr:DEAD/DEAH box helicase [Mesoterricola silvestris]BDU73133.1 DEAD/DEAH box helicase [Mesoterricola silvestris]
MPLNPITVVDQVLEEYRSYLSTEFQARDPQLRASLEAALNEAGFLAQEPFFQAHRAFRSGEKWRDLGLDAKLAQVMEERSGSPTAYLHQSESLIHLLGSEAGPLVVTTGTGSGKTECFLLPVIQNAIEDSARFNQSGLTAILVYPMNALANDQEERIRQYLEESGHTHVKVARYDRSTKDEERQKLRQHPPHILLTNYMMLEYLLVRPADRDALFANHRCRFVVLDEVHTYRGSLGANIALLFRRLLAHLRKARQDWAADDRSDRRRFPEVLPVATSATIKSVDETGRTAEEVQRLRDEAVREFLGKLTGIPEARFKVVGEQICDLLTPLEAQWPAAPAAELTLRLEDETGQRAILAQLAGRPADEPLAQLAREAGILWFLNSMLARRPMSVTQIVERVKAEVPERASTDPEVIRREVCAALLVGAALPDGMPGALRLRVHRFIRGGWQFTRCVDPACGRLYPMGEEQCTCGRAAAPLYLCRSCGADTLRFKTGPAGPESELLQPNADRQPDDEWMLYDRRRLEADEDEGLVGVEQQMRNRPVMQGSFDPATRAYSSDENLYPMRVALAPARNRCLVCGGTAGARNVITPVSLGTSAAVRVISEGLLEGLAVQNQDRPGHDGKERLLIFSDSRQDAAHQARFITYSGRYDRMRRRIVQVLKQRPNQQATLEEMLTQLMALGVQRGDNPNCDGYTNANYLPANVQAKVRAWEEAPLLDDLAISTGYRASLFNLGLVGVRYDRLESYVHEQGEELARSLGISTHQLLFLCRCLLEEMRKRSALSRPMICYHPQNPSCPEEFKGAADWERRIKSPAGFACEANGAPIGWLESNAVEDGITLSNIWRRPRAGGRGPSLERQYRHLLNRMGGVEPSADGLLSVLSFLAAPNGPRPLRANPLHGFRRTQSLLQVNADAVILEVVAPEDRYRCSICNVRMPWVVDGSPCPKCQGALQPWSEAEVNSNRYVQRILNPDILPLVAGEHTAQVTGDDRIELEDRFKAPPPSVPVAEGDTLRSTINVLACSPTLEMGIDVGGLDAVVMRNIPPRPDNYAQRGGRAGRRTRVGIVLGYARSTPHDGYFFDKPAEMIAGEVPAPGVGLGNRDVVLRHLHAMAFGSADPGLSGRMGDYINLQGQIDQAKVDALIASLRAQFPHAISLALDAWGEDVLVGAELATRESLEQVLEALPAKVQDLFDRTSLQIRTLQEDVSRWNELGGHAYRAVHARDLQERLLGIPSRRNGQEADDRSSGHPMRRFAEFGILPGYEFPTEPCTLRLLGDDHEEDPLSVARRFGIAQFQPDALVHARGHRWKVVGLDLSSPWNPKSQDPDWVYVRCRRCGLRFDHQTPACPRCGDDDPVDGGRGGYPGHAFGGFLAIRQDTPVLEEEDRFSIASLVTCHPQRDGRVMSRYRLVSGWIAELRFSETVRWVNEWKPPSASDRATGKPLLHEAARGFYLCPSCGRNLTVPDAQNNNGARRRPRRGEDRDPFEHARGCQLAGQPPMPRAITTAVPATTLRITVLLPRQFEEPEYKRWGLSLGYALRTGLRQLYLLDGPEIEFELEPMWDERDEGGVRRLGALTFIDPAVGGSGFLDRCADDLHLIAGRAIEHLDHPRCETACYRCLKSYANQRHHMHLSWPHIMPDLEALASEAPTRLSPELGDANDPRPWLEAYDSGVGSPLELKFLRLFQQHGLDVEKQVPVAPDSVGAPISSADFRVKDSKILIYVDGAAFHTGNRLRRDRAIRERLQKGAIGWIIVELRAVDLGRGEALVEDLLGMVKNDSGR